MSTALLDDATETLEDPQELVLDAVTHQRLEVAACAVDTLEALADTGAWDRLDPALADHLVQHARRLGGFLERVRHLPGVRACEQEMLAVRRVERRLEVALDLLVEDERAANTPNRSGRVKTGSRRTDEQFLGDFSEKTLTKEQRQAVRERRMKRKAAKKLLTPRGKRILMYSIVCVAMTVSSAVLVALGAMQGGGKSVASAPVSEPMTRNQYLEDVRVFLPAKMVMVQGNGATVMVRREWLLKTPDQRQVDADGAHVFLSNRAITGLELLWEDGGLIGRAEKGGHVVFAEGTSGLIGRQSAGTASEDDAAPIGLGPGPGARP